MDPATIAKRYLKTWLIVDVIVVLPQWGAYILLAMDYPSALPAMTLLAWRARGLRLVNKSFKLMVDLKQLTEGSNSIELCGAANIACCVMILFLWCHMAACGWYYWGATGWVILADVADKSLIIKYLLSLQYAMAQMQG